MVFRCHSITGCKATARRFDFIASNSHMQKPITMVFNALESTEKNVQIVIQFNAPV